MEDRRIEHNLLEFEKLKDEQINRIKFRDGLFYFTLAIIGGALTLACSSRNGYTADVLLAVPFALFVAGVSHIACDRRVDDIGIYIRDVLTSAVAEDEKVERKSVFAWEEFLRSAPLQVIRKLLRLMSTMMLYVGSGFASLLFYNVLKTAAASNVPVTAAQAANASGTAPALSWEGLAFWAGAYLMSLLFSLIILFTAVKWRRPKSEHKNWWLFWKWLRAFLALGATLCTGWAIIRFVPATFLDNLAKEMERLAVIAAKPLYVVAVFLALVVGSTIYLAARLVLRR